MAQQFVIFNRTSQTAEDIYGRAQLDQDTTQHFPWLFYTVGELGWQWWAVHLLGKWEHLPQYLAAPPEYDETYHQLKGERRTAWLAALRRVCNGVFEGAVLPAFDEDDDRYPLSINLREDYGGLKEDLFNAVRRGLKKLDEWLSWREQSAVTQLLPALSTIQLGVENGLVVLLDTALEVSDKRFSLLLEELQLHLVAGPTSESGLRILNRRLAALNKMELADMPDTIRGLQSIFAEIEWRNLEELPTFIATASSFWADLKATLASRAEWADKAALIISEALALPEPERKPTPVIKSTNHWQGILRPGFTLKDLNNLLVSLGILETADPIKLSYTTRPKDWVAVAQALRETSTPKPDMAVLHRAFDATYGPEGIRVGTARSFQRDTYKYNAFSNALYEKALALIRGRY